MAALLDRGQATCEKAGLQGFLDRAVVTWRPARDSARGSCVVAGSELVFSGTSRR
jgi:hypothetical protein